MRRLPRILLNAATVVSMVLCLATVAALSGLAPRSGHVRFWRFAGGWVLQQHRYTAIVIMARPHQVDDGWRWAQEDARRWYDRQDAVGLTRTASTPVRTGAYEVAQYAAWAPPWLWALATGLLPTSRVVLRRKSRRPNGAGRCAACGYDLRASPDRCPECGKVAA
jgi:hypothetical protein